MDCSRPRTRDPAEWLETCPEFSWPLAERVREWILDWEPDLTESVKWNMLCFSGHRLVCGLSACQRHLGITFFRGTELPDPTGLLVPAPQASNILSVRMTSLKGTERDALKALVQAAVALDADPEAPPPVRVRRPELPLPGFLSEALARDSRAEAGFRALPPSCRREFIVWLASAKRPETRARRLVDTLSALRSGLRWGQMQRQAPTRRPGKPEALAGGGARGRSSGTLAVGAGRDAPPIRRRRAKYA